MHSFTPTVLEGDSTAFVYLLGVGLDTDAVVGTIRSLRFERAVTCSPTVNTTNPASMTDLSQALLASNFSSLSVPLSQFGGLSAGVWSLCIDWTASTSVDPYVQLQSSNTSNVLVGEFVSFLALV